MKGCGPGWCLLLAEYPPLQMLAKSMHMSSVETKLKRELQLKALIDMSSIPAEVTLRSFVSMQKAAFLFLLTLIGEISA